MPEPVHFEAAVALAGSWSDNWLWGLPLIVLNVLAHCFGLFNVREHEPSSCRLCTKSATL